MILQQVGGKPRFCLNHGVCPWAPESNTAFLPFSLQVPCADLSSAADMPALHVRTVLSRVHSFPARDLEIYLSLLLFFPSFSHPSPASSLWLVEGGVSHAPSEFPLLSQSPLAPRSQQRSRASTLALWPPESPKHEGSSLTRQARRKIQIAGGGAEVSCEEEVASMWAGL